MITAGFRVMTCADAGFFHFLPTLEKNIFAHQGEYPVIYDIGMTEEQVASSKVRLLKLLRLKDLVGPLLAVRSRQFTNHAALSIS